MRLNPLIAAALCFILSSPLFAQDCIEYENRTDFFTVSLPGQPTVREFTYKTEYSTALPARV